MEGTFKTCSAMTFKRRMEGTESSTVGSKCYFKYILFYPLKYTCKLFNWIDKHPCILLTLWFFVAISSLFYCNRQYLNHMNYLKCRTFSVLKPYRLKFCLSFSPYWCLLPNDTVSLEVFIQMTNWCSNRNDVLLSNYNLFSVDYIYF